MSHSEASCSDVETIEEVVVLVFQEHLVDAEIPFQFGSLLVAMLWQGSCDERHEGTTEVMFGEGDNGSIEFSLQKIQEMSCALLMQSGKVILCGIGFYKVHSPREQSVLVHYG